MGTNDRAFEKVKSILGKLDRNIDQARARRLQDVPVTSNNFPHPKPQPSHSPFLTSSTAVLDHPTPNHHPMPSPITKPPAPSKSGFGRAQPLRRSNPNPNM